jgi:hypothetical protein
LKSFARSERSFTFFVTTAFFFSCFVPTLFFGSWVAAYDVPASASTSAT